MTSDAFGSTSVTDNKRRMETREWLRTSPAHVYSDVNKQLIQEGMEGSEEAGDAIKKIMPAYLEFKSS